MKLGHIVAGAVIAGGLVDAAGADPMPMDSPITMGSIGDQCVRASAPARDDPRWAAYPIKLEFSNGGAQFLAGAHVTLSNAAGKSLADFDCSGPWVLFRLPRGIYTVTATITGETAGPSKATFQPPESGQKRVELRFNIPANK